MELHDAMTFSGALHWLSAVEKGEEKTDSPQQLERNKQFVILTMRNSLEDYYIEREPFLYVPAVAMPFLDELDEEALRLPEIGQQLQLFRLNPHTHPSARIEAWLFLFSRRVDALIIAVMAPLDVQLLVSRVSEYYGPRANILLVGLEETRREAEQRPFTFLIQRANEMARWSGGESGYALLVFEEDRATYAFLDRLPYRGEILRGVPDEQMEPPEVIRLADELRGADQVDVMSIIDVFYVICETLRLNSTSPVANRFRFLDRGTRGAFRTDFLRHFYLTHALTPPTEQMDVVPAPVPIYYTTKDPIDAMTRLVVAMSAKDEEYTRKKLNEAIRQRLTEHGYGAGVSERFRERLRETIVDLLVNHRGMPPDDIAARLESFRQYK